MAALVFTLVSAVFAGEPQRGGGAGTAPAPPALVAAAKPLVATGCDESLWAHVYHSTRLQVVARCIEVTGTIHHIKKESDGDDHIQLKVDSQFETLLNDRNKTVQAGCLVVEPVCENPVTQPDAISACRDFHATVNVGAKGRVKVLGAYVLDTEANHGWTEIHPVTSVTAVP
jgi:hypothetical protein